MIKGRTFRLTGRGGDNRECLKQQYIATLVFLHDPRTSLMIPCHCLIRGFAKIPLLRLHSVFGERQITSVLFKEEVKRNTRLGETA